MPKLHTLLLAALPAIALAQTTAYKAAWYQSTYTGKSFQTSDKGSLWNWADEIGLGSAWSTETCAEIAYDYGAKFFMFYHPEGWCAVTVPSRTTMPPLSSAGGYEIFTKSDTAPPTSYPTAAPTTKSPTAFPTTQSPTASPTVGSVAQALTAGDLDAGLGFVVGRSGDNVYLCESDMNCRVNSAASRSTWTLIASNSPDLANAAVVESSVETNDGVWTVEPNAVSFVSNSNDSGYRFPVECSCLNGGGSP